MINVKNANYIDIGEVEKIIGDRWYNMPCTEDVGNDSWVMLDLSLEHMAELEDDYQYYMNAVLDEDIAISNRSTNLAAQCNNELTLIHALRKEYYDHMLILISY